MKPSEDPKLLEIVKATGEIYGKQVSVAAALMFLADLDGYSSQMVVGALSRCRKELRTFPTVSDVISRIDDGRPGVEEAWALVPKDEYGSVIWNDEIAEAYGVCRSMIDDDPIAARMAFKESYLAVVGRNRSEGKRPEWSPSFGFEKAGRHAAVSEAVQKNRISQDHACLLLPDFSTPAVQTPQLPGPDGNPPIRLNFLKRIPE